MIQFISFIKAKEELNTYSILYAQFYESKSGRKLGIQCRGKQCNL